jgi:hypothetical protein
MHNKVQKFIKQKTVYYMKKSSNSVNTLLAAVCWLFGHRYKVTRRITKSIAELQCPRCKKEFGINTSAQALLPMDDELRSLHRELSNCG